MKSITVQIQIQLIQRNTGSKEKHLNAFHSVNLVKELIMFGNENDKDNVKVIMVSRLFQCQSISHRTMSMTPKNQQVISRGDFSGQGFVCFSSAAEYQQLISHPHVQPAQLWDRGEPINSVSLVNNEESNLKAYN